MSKPKLVARSMSAMTDIAIATSPKSAGTRRRASTDVLITPTDRSSNLDRTIHVAPRAISRLMRPFGNPLAEAATHGPAVCRQTSGAQTLHRCSVRCQHFSAVIGRSHSESRSRLHGTERSAWLAVARTLRSLDSAAHPLDKGWPRVLPQDHGHCTPALRTPQRIRAKFTP